MSLSGAFQVALIACWNGEHPSPVRSMEVVGGAQVPAQEALAAVAGLPCAIDGFSCNASSCQYQSRTVVPSTLFRCTRHEILEMHLAQIDKNGQPNPSGLFFYRTRLSWLGRSIHLVDYVVDECVVTGHLVRAPGLPTPAPW